MSQYGIPDEKSCLWVIAIVCIFSALIGAGICVVVQGCSHHVEVRLK